MGGLAAAVELRAAGHDVVVLERAAVPGGKASAALVGGVWVEQGPTVLTMRWVFDELFASAGRSLGDYVELDRARILARHAWSDGSRLDLHAELEESVRAVADFAGRDEGARYRAFAARTREAYEAVDATFMRAQRPTLGSLVGAGRVDWRALAAIDPLRTMWGSLGRAFRDPRLRQLFARYATYCGASPFEAPAILNVIAHVEAEGVWRVRGGLSALAGALAGMARELGVVLRYDAPVAEVLVRSRAEGVRLASGEAIRADAVLVNADVEALARAALGERAARAVARVSSRSLSAATWTAVGTARGLPLAHHTVFFSDDYRAEFDDLMRARRAPSSPTIYVCAQDRADEACSPADDERFLVVMNAPATGDEPDRWPDTERRRCERAAFETMTRCGLELRPRARAMTTPVEIEARFPRTGGALYGPRQRGPFSALRREGARTRVPGLYLAGGSVHPGPGVPMAATSGRLAARTIDEDLASIGRSRSAATAGATSTA